MINSLAASMIVSALGAALTYCLARLWRLVRQRRAERPCCLAGTFVTEFEDHRGSRHRHAVTRLSQRGHEIRGTTTELRSQRSWQLYGQIDHSGFLRGTYAAPDSPERLIGTFLLAINHDKGSLEGLWSHYDAMSREIFGGEYLMRRCAGRQPPFRSEV